MSRHAPFIPGIFRPCYGDRNSASHLASGLWGMVCVRNLANPNCWKYLVDTCCSFLKALREFVNGTIVGGRKKRYIFPSFLGGGRKEIPGGDGKTTEHFCIWASLRYEYFWWFPTSLEPYIYFKRLLGNYVSLARVLNQPLLGQKIQGIGIHQSTQNPNWVDGSVCNQHVDLFEFLFPLCLWDSQQRRNRSW